MKSFEAIIVRVSRPFAYNKDGMVNSCIKMLVDVKNVGKRVLTFIPEKEYSNYSFTRLSPTDNLKELSPFGFRFSVRKGRQAACQAQGKCGRKLAVLRH